MRLNEVHYDDSKPVDGYGPGFFRVGGVVIEGGVLLLPSGVSPWDGYEASAPLLAAAPEIDVLLLGTGSEIAHIPAKLRDALEGAGVGLEVMASPSACRTYNVLLAEGRRIGAAILPVPGGTG
ncbi:Mth938-like domain-containing protein [Rhodophyticola porphyridii]|uniref:Mth938-like domain-containing protein n=1 Tax=Rhodophyticola porphyridii TaxID=1852017 RepID=UPI0035D0151D